MNPEKRPDRSRYRLSFVKLDFFGTVLSSQSFIVQAPLTGNAVPATYIPVAPYAFSSVTMPLIFFYCGRHLENRTTQICLDLAITVPDMHQITT